MIPHIAIGIICVGGVVLIGAALVPIVIKEYREWEERQQIRETERECRQLMPVKAEAPEPGDKVKERSSRRGGLRTRKGYQQMEENSELTSTKRGLSLDTSNFTLGSDADSPLMPRGVDGLAHLKPRESQTHFEEPMTESLPVPPPLVPLSRGGSSNGSDATAPLLSPTFTTPTLQGSAPIEQDEWDIVKGKIGDSPDWDHISAGSEAGWEHLEAAR